MKQPPPQAHLTAYALGDDEHLTDQERHAVEVAYQTDPAVRAEVDATRTTATSLTRSLAAELKHTQRLNLENPTSTNAGSAAANEPRGPFQLRPWMLPTGLAAAAAVAAAVTLLPPLLDQAQNAPDTVAHEATPPGVAGDAQRPLSGRDTALGRNATADDALAYDVAEDAAPDIAEDLADLDAFNTPHPLAEAARGEGAGIAAAPGNIAPTSDAPRGNTARGAIAQTHESIAGGAEREETPGRAGTPTDGLLTTRARNTIAPEADPAAPPTPSPADRRTGGRAHSESRGAVEFSAGVPVEPAAGGFGGGQSPDTSSGGAAQPDDAHRVRIGEYLAAADRAAAAGDYNAAREYADAAAATTLNSSITESERLRLQQATQARVDRYTLREQNEMAAAEAPLARQRSRELGRERRSIEGQASERVYDLLTRAVEQQRAGNYDDAIANVEEALFIDGDNPAAQLLGDVLVQDLRLVEQGNAPAADRLDAITDAFQEVETATLLDDIVTYPENWPTLTTVQPNPRQAREWLAQLHALESTNAQRMSTLQTQLDTARRQADQLLDPAAGAEEAADEPDANLGDSLASLIQVQRELNAHEHFARDIATQRDRIERLRRHQVADLSREQYAPLVDQPFFTPADQPLSTFSIDVDTASYANVRRFLDAGTLPPPDAVRIEELINRFDYAYAETVVDPDELGDVAPFASSIEVASCPWNESHRLLRIGLKGVEVAAEERPDANVVFLIDVSGSMRDANKLPLVQQGLVMLTESLNVTDRVAIVTYASGSNVALPSTSANEPGAIIDTINGLTAGGSTNGAGGLALAYEQARDNFLPQGVNRVILCTDGDFNVGPSSTDAMLDLIAEQANYPDGQNVYLTVLGFGTGNLNDAMLEAITNRGNGAFGYVPGAEEARTQMVDRLTGQLFTIAKDVKVQVEFNPARVAGYRLIGYANRVLRAEDFNNDRVDAGDLGAGHTVTALYEVVPAGLPIPAADGGTIDPLRYQRPAGADDAPIDGELTDAALDEADELAYIKLRYKPTNAPAGDDAVGTSLLLEFPALDSDASWADASPDFRFAASVATFGQALRHSPHVGGLPAGVELAVRLADDQALGTSDDRAAYAAMARDLLHALTPPVAEPAEPTDAASE